MPLKSLELEETEVMPKYMQSPTSQPWLVQFWNILKLQYTDYRGNAPFLLLFGLIMPLGLFWLLQTYVELNEKATWLVAGNMVMAVSYGSVNYAIQRIAVMKLSGELDFYGTLPIKKSSFFAALFTLGMISTLPGIISNIIIGHYVLHISFTLLLWALPLTLLAAASLTVIGATVGSLVNSYSQLNLCFYLSYVVVTFLCPVIVPFDQLPMVLKWTSYLLPPGEAAIALMDALRGNYNMRFWIMTTSLLAWLVLAVTVGLRKMDWRKN